MDKIIEIIIRSMQISGIIILVSIIVWICRYIFKNFNDYKRKKRVINLPETLEEAIEALLIFIASDVDISSQSMLLRSPEDFAIIFHSTLGRSIRNNWGLWDKESSLYKDLNFRFGLWHGDDMSGLIMQCAWEKINGKDPKPEVYAKKFLLYWKSNSKQQKEKN